MIDDKIESLVAEQGFLGPVEKKFSFESDDSNLRAEGIHNRRLVTEGID